jgi:hypothetical protein
LAESPGTRTRQLALQPLMTPFRSFRRRGMCSIHGRIRMPHTGGASLHPNP